MSYNPNAPNRFETDGSVMYGSEAIELHNPAREEAPQPTTDTGGTGIFTDESSRRTGYMIHNEDGSVKHMAQFSEVEVIFYDNFGTEDLGP